MEGNTQKGIICDEKYNSLKKKKKETELSNSSIVNSLIIVIIFRHNRNLITFNINVSLIEGNKP